MARRIRAISNHLAGATVDEAELDKQTTALIRQLREDYGEKPADGIQTKGLNHLALVSSDMKRTW